MSRAISKLMIEQGHGGRIVLVSSILAFSSLPDLSTYAASKVLST